MLGKRTWQTMRAAPAAALLFLAAACGDDATGSADAAVIPADMGVDAADQSSVPADRGPDVVCPLDSAPPVDSVVVDSAPPADAAPPPDTTPWPDVTAWPDTVAWPDQPPPTYLFTEDFKSDQRLNKAKTKAKHDSTGTGWMRGKPLPMASAGTGAKGDLKVTTATTLQPGDLNHKGAEISAKVTVSGNLPLRLTKDLKLNKGGELLVKGDLLLVVGGIAQIDGKIETKGNLTIHQPSDKGGTITSTVRADKLPAGGSGALTVHSRGALTVSGSAFVQTNSASGNNFSGNITLRTYGGVTVCGSSFLQPGYGGAKAGDLTIWTEGSVVVEKSSFLGRQDTGSKTMVRSIKGVKVDGKSFFQSGSGGLDIVTEGPLEVLDKSFMQSYQGKSPSDVLISAKSLIVSGGSFLQARKSSTIRGGELKILLGGAASISGTSFVQAGDGDCVPGGDITLLAEGAVSISGSSYFQAGDSRSKSGCPKQTGGTLTIKSKGSVTVSPDSKVEAGSGSTAGKATQQAIATVKVSPIDAGLFQTLAVQSKAVTLKVAMAAVTKTAVTWNNAAGTSGEVELSLDGKAAYQALSAVTKKSISSGFKYRAQLKSRMFDAAALDGFSIWYQ